MYEKVQKPDENPRANHKPYNCREIPVLTCLPLEMNVIVINDNIINEKRNLGQGSPVILFIFILFRFWVFYSSTLFCEIRQLLMCSVFLLLKIVETFISHPRSNFPARETFDN